MAETERKIVKSEILEFSEDPESFIGFEVDTKDGENISEMSKKYLGKINLLRKQMELINYPDNKYNLDASPGDVDIEHLETDSDNEILISDKDDEVGNSTVPNRSHKFQFRINVGSLVKRNKVIKDFKNIRKISESNCNDEDYNIAEPEVIISYPKDDEKVVDLQYFETQDKQLPNSEMDMNYRKLLDENKCIASSFVERNQISPSEQFHISSKHSKSENGKERTGNIVTKKKSVNCNQNLNTDAFLQPLLQGWKRQVVKRGNCYKGRKDVYYFAPCGKKLRSSTETEKYLRERNSSLTKENFSFKQIIYGFGEQYEVVRDARVKIPSPQKNVKEKLKKVKNNAKNSTSTNGHFSLLAHVKDELNFNTSNLLSNVKEKVIDDGGGTNVVEFEELLEDMKPPCEPYSPSQEESSSRISFPESKLSNSDQTLQTDTSVSNKNTFGSVNHRESNHLFNSQNQPRTPLETNSQDPILANCKKRQENYNTIANIRRDLSTQIPGTELPNGLASKDLSESVNAQDGSKRPEIPLFQLTLEDVDEEQKKPVCKIRVKSLEELCCKGPSTNVQTDDVNPISSKMPEPEPILANPNFVQNLPKTGYAQVCHENVSVNNLPKPPVYKLLLTPGVKFSVGNNSPVYFVSQSGRGTVNNGNINLPCSQVIPDVQKGPTLLCTLPFNQPLSNSNFIPNLPILTTKSISSNMQKNETYLPPFNSKVVENLNRSVSPLIRETNINSVNSLQAQDTYCFNDSSRSILPKSFPRYKSRTNSSCNNGPKDPMGFYPKICKRSRVYGLQNEFGDSNFKIVTRKKLFKRMKGPNTSLNSCMTNNNNDDVITLS